MIDSTAIYPTVTGAMTACFTIGMHVHTDITVITRAISVATPLTDIIVNTCTMIVTAKRPSLRRHLAKLLVD